MLEDTTQTSDAVRELASYGVRFSLEDFGVGYSSLGYIQSYPISTIKIDKKFIDNIDTDRVCAAIIAAVFELAARIDLDIIAGLLALMGLHDLKARSQVLRLGGRR